MKSEAALAVAAELLSQPVTDRVNWTLPRLQTEIAARSTLTISKSQLSKTLKKGVSLAPSAPLLERTTGPRGGGSQRPAAVPVVLVRDNGPIHVSKLTRAELARRPWLTIEWLPKYAPELNDIERAWRDLKRHFLAHQTFRSVEAAQAAVVDAIQKLHQERITHVCLVQRIAA